MSREEKEIIFEEFKKYLKEFYRIEDVKLKHDFKRDLGLSSFDFISIVCVLEKKYGVYFNPDDYRKLYTIEDVIDYIISQKNNAKMEE